MEEKILVKSERYNVKRGLVIFFIIIAILCSLYYVGLYLNELAEAQMDWEDCYCSSWGKCYIHERYSSPADAAWKWSEGYRWTVEGIIGGIGVICLLIYAWMRSYEMIVTDKRVYGQAAFGKRVDLPVDSVSAIGSKWPKGIAVATSSGKIAFLMIKNRDEIHKCVSDLLIERQSKPTATATPVVKQEIPQSNAEELKKYKELLDMGVITQEEFDAKKKQILGL